MPGWMKKTGGSSRLWRKRWFVLTRHGVLLYDKDRARAKEGMWRGNVQLSPETIAVEEDTPKKGANLLLADCQLSQVRLS